MALTRITKGVIKPNENYDTHNINSTGIVTAVGANFSGNVSVGGVLTYEDVTNIDSVGVITARQGIFIDDSITHIGDTNTKIRFPAADTVSVETGGAERLRITSDGRIGFNDSTPNDYELDIQKRAAADDAQIRLHNNATGSSNDTVMRYSIAGTTANNYIYFGDGADANAGQIRYSHSNNFLSIHTNAAERLRITNEGRVGLGTNNPGQEVDIWSNSPAIRLTDTDPFEAGAYGTIAQSGSVLQILAHSGNTSSHGSVFFYSYNDNDSFNTYRITDNYHNWYISGTQKMTLNSSGYLGIGTISPSLPLDVRGDIIAYTSSTKSVRLVDDGNIEITNNNGGIIDFKTADNEDFDCRIRQVSNGLQFMTGGNGSTNERLRITSSGHVNIAPNNLDQTAYKVQIETGTNRFLSIKTANHDDFSDEGSGIFFSRQSDGSKELSGIFAHTNTSLGMASRQHLTFHAGGSGGYSQSPERLRITNQGLVGIGTNNPLSLLSLYSDAADEVLLHFDMGDATDRRGWKFKQGSTGTSTELILQADANGKVFQIESASGAEMFYAYTASSGGFIRINPELHISDYIKHIGDHDTNIRFPADNTFTVETAGSERLRITPAGNLIHTSTDKTLSLVDTRNVSNAGTKIAFFGANRYDTDEEFAAIKGLLVSNSGGSGNKQNGGLQFVVGSASHTHTMSQGGYVGIATGNPQALLHLQGTGGNTSGLYFKNGPHDVVRQYFVNSNDNSDFVITYDGTGGAEITLEQTGNLVLNESNGGKVVIGNTSVTPENPLIVAAASASAILEIQRTSANSTGAIGALNFTAVDGHSVANIYALGDGDNEGAHLIFKTTSAAAENSPYGSGTAERVRIKSNGYVGINTSDPLSMLDLRGDLNINNNTIISNFDSNGVGGSNIDHIWHSDAGNYGRGGTWHFVSDTTYKATGNSVIQIGYLSCDGGAHFAANNVAIGLTTVSRGPLHVHNNSGDDCQIHMTNNDTGTTSSDGMTLFTDTDTSGIWSREDVPFDIAVNGTRSIRLHNTGGLSINTTSKSTSALLHVDNHGERNTNSDVSNSSQYVIVNDCHFGGSGGTLSGNRSKAGIRNDIEFTSTTPSSTVSGNRFSVFGIHNDVHATKFAYVTDGIYSFVKQSADNQPSSSGTATVRGVYGYAQGYCTNSQGNVNIHGGYFLGYRGGDVNAGHCYGVYARAHNTNGTSNTGDLTGVYAEWEQDEGSTISNAYCFRGYGDRDAGTVTNGYILNGSFGGDGSITNRWGVYIGDSAKNRLGGELTVTGDLVVNGSSKQFRIPHPIVGLSTTKDLVHAAIEGPQIDLIYRGKVDLVNGTATVNLDTKSRMTEGTFVLLNRDVQCFTTNETGWTNVKGSVTGNQLTIIAQENTCTDTISWMVIGERQDDAVKQSTSTNNDGKLIMEPLKEILPDADFEQPECEKNIYNEE